MRILKFYIYQPLFLNSIYTTYLKQFHFWIFQ
eukprot:UN00223